MQSQIGPASQGQSSNPILAAIGKENGSRSSDNAREHESFQSVLADASGATQKDQVARSSTEVAEAKPEPESAETTDEDGINSLPDDEATPMFLTDDADELVFKKKPNLPALKSGDVVQLVAQVAKAIETNGAAGKSAEAPAPVTAAVTRADTAAPAWFSTSRMADVAAQPTGNAATKADGAVPASDQATMTKAIATNETLVRASGENANQQVKPETKAAEKAVVPMAQAIKADEEPKHVTERRLAPEEPAPVFATQRNAAPTVGGTLAFAAQMQTTARTTTAGVPAEERGVRWMSEAGLTSEIAAQDMPATSRIQQASLLQQPDLPRNIAVQIAQAMRQGGADRPMELVLSPAELGRVRISMQAGDGAMMVHVMADRPETLDLMRRHIDILAQEFHDIGFGTAEFAFGQNTTEDGKQRDGDTDAGSLTARSSQDDADGAAETVAPAQLSLHSDRVDIRL